MIAYLGAVAMGAAMGTQGAERSVEMRAVNERGVQERIGQIIVKEREDGLVFEPRIESGLSPGIHGFHVHQYPDCGPQAPDGERGPALAAGSHLDPNDSDAHSTPWDDEGHLGDLPALYVTADEKAIHPVFARGLRLSDVEGRALVIHEGGDNYADQPEPLGGGGDRAACGVIDEG